MNALLSIFRTERKSMKGCRPLDPQERIDAYRDQLRSREDYDPYTHDAKMIHGIAWVGEFIRRPIPHHRSLTIIPGPAGQLRRGDV